MSDQININQLSNALQQKVDLPSGKTQMDIDYVVEWQKPTSANNYTWYRLYKSGWIEQGGVLSSSTTNITVNLPKTMSNTKYTILLAVDDGDGNAYNTTTAYFTKTNSSFQTNSSLGGTYYPTEISWEVKGFIAQS